MSILSLEQIIVGKSGFLVYPNIFAAFSEFRDEIMERVDKSIVLQSINTTFFSVVSNQNTSQIQIIIYCDAAQSKLPPNQLLKMLFYRILSTFSQILSPRVIQLIHQILPTVMRICAEQSGKQTAFKQVTASYLNDIILKLVKDPVLTQQQIEESGMSASFISSFDNSKQNFIYQLHERLKKRFVLSGVASVLSIVTGDLCVPVVNDQVVIQLSTPFRQDIDFIENIPKDQLAYNIQVSMIGHQSCIPLNGVYIQNPFQVLIEMSQENRNKYEKSVLACFKKMHYTDMFHIMRQTVDNTLQYRLQSGENIFDSIAYSSLQTPPAGFSKLYTPSYMDYNIAVTHTIAIIQKTIEEHV